MSKQPECKKCSDYIQHGPALCGDCLEFAIGEIKDCLRLMESASQGSLPKTEFCTMLRAVLELLEPKS